MSISVRSLYARVSVFRPDIKDTALFGFCLDEAIRDVCRETMAARITLPAVPFTDGMTTLNVDTAMVLSGGLVKIHAVSMVVLASSNASFPVGYACDLEESAPGKALSQRKVMGYWAQAGDFLYLSGAPTGFTGTLSITASYMPLAETDPCPLPSNAVGAVIAAMESMVFLIPGPGVDINRALRAGKLAKTLKGQLRAETYFGNSGQPEMKIDTTPY